MNKNIIPDNNSFSVGAFGCCVNEETVEEIFGSISEFARLVEENGDNFIYDDVKVKYDEFADIHYFHDIKG